MKKFIPQHFTDDLAVVKLYESDLREIIELLSAAKPDTEIAIEDGQAAFDSLEDLRENRGDLVRELEIEGRFTTHQPVYQSGYLAVAFKEQSVGITATKEYELEFRRLKQFLRDRARVVGRIPSPIWFMLGGALFVLIVVTPSVIASVFALQGWRKWGITGIGWAAAFGLWNGPSFRRNLLVLRKKHEHPTFLKRHEESIVRVGLTVLGGVVGGIVTYFLRK